MTPEHAVERLNVILAHAWMIRTFLKHAEEIQEDEEMLAVPRTIFDYCRAVEPAHQRGDVKEYLHRIRGKLSKLRQVAEFFAENHKRASDHTNFQMAALSLSGCVREIEEVLAALPKTSGSTEVKASSHSEPTPQSAENDKHAPGI
jgi:hypothetical protein